MSLILDYLSKAQKNREAIEATPDPEEETPIDGPLPVITLFRMVTVIVLIIALATIGYVVSQYALRGLSPGEVLANWGIPGLG